MSPWPRVVAFVSRLRGLFARRRLAREAQQEIEMHLDLLTHQYIRGGNPPTEARRLARAKFGGVAQLRESLRDQAGFPMLESVLRDVRYAARGLLRSPGFSLVVVLTLGVGIGANAAVFSFVNAVLLRPLPYPEADRLVTVQESDPPAPFLVTPGRLRRLEGTRRRLRDAVRVPLQRVRTDRAVRRRRASVHRRGVVGLLSDPPRAAPPGADVSSS